MDEYLDLMIRHVQMNYPTVHGTIKPGADHKNLSHLTLEVFTSTFPSKGGIYTAVPSPLQRI